MIQKIFYVLFALTALYNLYFLISCMFSFKKKKDIGKYKAKHNIAVLIAARNEEAVIGSLVESLVNQDYAKELYEVFVVSNNCTDSTEQIAKKAGANILRCKDKISCKGEALKYGFQKLLPQNKFDAFLIFDADNVVAPNYLSRMNDALCEGYLVAEGFRDCKNPSDSWLCGCYALFYMFQNTFFNQSRQNLNGSSSINGTGFLIKKDVLETYGYDTITFTEDVEFTIQCANRGIQIAFVRDAITYDEQPNKFASSWKQRKRWTVGNYQCLFHYFRELWCQMFRRKSMSCLDMIMIVISPLVQLISVLTFMLFIIYQLFLMATVIQFYIFFAFNIIVLIFSYLVVVLLCVFLTKYNGKSLRSIWSGILLFPIFVLTWIPLNMIYLFRQNIVWDHIEHNRNIKADAFIK